MIDGVAPRAKMNQQRERRYKKTFLSKYNKEEEEEEEEEENKENKKDWDSNKITPGTFFMEKIKDALYILKKDTIDLYDIHISDSNECGEGEHKMMTCISELNPERRVCIYGLDADLIMLSLLNKYSSKIILLRDNQNKNSEKDETFTFIDIGKLKNNIINDINNDIKRELKIDFEKNNNNNIIVDYIFLCFFLGNDFLEHVPSLQIKENGIGVLLKYYIMVFVKRKEFLINLSNELKDCINLDFLKDLFYHLSKSEEYFFNNVYSVYKKDDKRIIYKDNFDMTNEYKDIYIYKNDVIQYNKVGFKKRYYNFYGVLDINDSCKSYINGLYWIIGYYNNHSHQNWSWFYNYKAIPFASDIYNYLLNCKEKQITILNEKTIIKTKPFTPLEQLLFVLPKESLLEILFKQDKNIYDKLKRLFNTNGKEIEEYYPNHICLDMINKEFMWQSKIFLKDPKNNLFYFFI